MCSFTVSFCATKAWMFFFLGRVPRIGEVCTAYFESIFARICLGTLRCWTSAQECLKPRLLKDLIIVAQNGLRRSWDSVYIIVVSQIHDAYLIPAADPITRWLKGQHCRVKLWRRWSGQVQIYYLDKANERVTQGGTREFKTVTQPHSVAPRPQPPPSLASLFPSSRHVFVCDSSKYSLKVPPKKPPNPQDRGACMNLGRLNTK